MSNGKGIGGHTLQGNGRHELWLTPPQVISVLGDFDLDPCACPEPRPWPTARRHIALPEDGLRADWSGRVWCNPPYGTKIGPWMARMGEHSNGIALTFARTDTEFWQKWIWPHADSVLFISGRLYFYFPDGTCSPHNAGGPSALIAYTQFDTEILRRSGIAGAHVARISVPADSEAFPVALSTRVHAEEGDPASQALNDEELDARSDLAGAGSI